MSLTKEEIKSAILGHLNTLAARSKGLEDYSLHGITQAFSGFSREQVVGALSELESDGSIQERHLEFDVFLPAQNKPSEQIVRNLAKRGFLTYSPFVSIAAVLLIIAMPILYFLPQVTAPTAATTIPLAYTIGIGTGIFLAAFVGVFFGYVLQRLIVRYKSGRIVYEESYRVIVTYVKFIAILFTALTLAYLAWTYYTNASVQAEVIFTVLGASALIVFGFEQALRRMKGSKQNSEDWG